MREADKSYLWCTEAWFRTKPGTTPRMLRVPKYSLTKYLFINVFNYNAIIAYFTVLKPGTLYLA